MLKLPWEFWHGPHGPRAYTVMPIRPLSTHLFLNYLAKKKRNLYNHSIVVLRPFKMIPLAPTATLNCIFGYISYY